VTTIRQTGHAARVEDYAQTPGDGAAVVRAAGMRSAVGSPIVVEGGVWGAIVLLSPRRASLPEDTGARLADFTELVATAIANAESRAALSQLADEQAALRRVATLVAREASPVELLAAVAEEVARVLDVEAVGMLRFEPDGTATLVARSDTPWDPPPLGTRFTLEGENVVTAVFRTREAARLDDWAKATGPVAEMARVLGIRSSVATPIVVERRLWGTLIAVTSQSEPVPRETDSRIGEFTELVATAIANAGARDELSRLVEEQAALRRVATLVAKGATPNQVFDAVRVEVEQMFGIPNTIIVRFDADDGATLLATPGEYLGPIGTRWRLKGDDSAVARVYRTGRAARADYTAGRGGPLAEAARLGGTRFPVAVPVVVDGALWGAMSVGSPGPQPPPNLEGRLAKFTELLATAIANTEARTEVQRLADEQAALRRVATLVAKGAKSEALFSAVAHEVAHVFGVQHVTVCRYEPDTILVLSSFEAPEPAAAPPPFPAGRRLPLDVPTLPASVHRTGEPARIDDFTASHGLYAVARQAGLTAAVGVPIIVDGAVWGSINTASTKAGPFPADAEERLARFTDLIATAVSNAAMRAELAASRARVIAAADESRRRIERDLHDGAQQQLVTLAVAMQRAQARIPSALDEVRADIGRVADGLTGAVNELRDLSRGIHPAILTEGGLSPALKALGRRSEVRVKLEVGFEHRLPDQVEVAAYYTVSEALTNASKHANATRVWVSLRVDHDMLRLSIRDDGVGGADANRGSGLTGLRDRIEALGGKIQIGSPSGSGTLIEGEIPIAGPADRNPEPDELPAQATTPAASG
jgi:signal transduction histidine kinase